MSTLKGIDVSYHNGNINWKKVKSCGIDFAIIRAGYGCTTDKNFKTYIQNAKNNGIAVGIYWFCYALNVNEAVAEADYCKKIISSYKIDLPVYYDFEYDTERYANEKGVTHTKDSRTDIIVAFCNRIKQYNYKAGVYINQDYIKYKTNFSELKKYDLWLAAWLRQSGTVTFDEVNPDSVNNSYGTVQAWQIGKQKIDGITNAVDVNYGYYKDFNPSTSVTNGSSTSTPITNPIVNSTFKAGDKVKVVSTFTLNNKKRAKTYSGGSFVLYYDTYDVISASGDKVLIGIGKVATAYVNSDILSLVSENTSNTISNLKPNSSLSANTMLLGIGKLVRIKLNARDYNGGRLAPFVYTKTYYVYQLKNDRAVLSTKMTGGVIIAAVNVKDLILYG